MSTSLGVAAVTTVLRDIITNRVAAGPVASAIGPVSVSAGAPDRVDLSGADDPNQINIFLHRVTHNPGWANVDLPARDGRARRLRSPPLVLDLHYLLSLYGAEPCYAEILLGEVMQEFHDRPVPARERIDAALNPTSPPTGFPTELADSGLAEQIESIRITPEAVSNEEVSKLWAALQARYRLTVAYSVTTVIIEGRETGRAALPVRRPLGYAEALKLPRITAVAADAGDDAPIVAGAALRLRGENLSADDLQVQVAEVDMTARITAADDRRIVLELPDPLPGGVHAGAAAVRVVHRRPISDPLEPRNVIASNSAVFVLRPQVSAAVTVDGSEVIDGVTFRSGALSLTLAPPVRRDQRVTVLLNQSVAPFRAYTLRAPDGNGVVAPAADTAGVTVPFRRLAAGTYLLRVQVDLAESVLAVDGTGAYAGPAVTV